MPRQQPLASPVSIGAPQCCLWMAVKDAANVCKKRSAEQLHADGLTMGKGADIFALVSRGRRSDRIPSRESPRHFAASMDESVIVGYYTLKKCRSPAFRCLQISKKGKIQWQEMME